MFEDIRTARGVVCYLVNIIIQEAGKEVRVCEVTRLVGQLSIQFMQVSDKCFVQLLLQQSLNTVINWIQIWRIWRPQLSWDKFWSFGVLFFSGYTVLMSSTRQEVQTKKLIKN